MNDDKCRCECKELLDKGVFENPSNCQCECDKSCDFGEYLDYKNCKCREKLAHKLAEECAENVEEVKIAGKYEHECSSCILYIALFSIIFTINVGIATYFVYYKYMNHNKENISKYDYVFQGKNYQNKWEKSNK